jgi:hypothetical protein
MGWLTRVILGAVVAASLAACDGDKKDAADAETSHPTEDARSRIADVLVAAQQGMAELTDYTYRGTLKLPKDPSNVLGGRHVTATIKVTADGRCQTVLTFEDLGNMIRRSIDGTTYQQYSDELLANATLDDATKDVLRDHWTAQPDSPDANCDISQISRSLDLTTARELGSSVIRGVDAVGFQGHADTDARVKVRVWLSTGDDARVLRITGGIPGGDSTITLVSENDGFTIDKPPAGAVVHP